MRATVGKGHVQPRNGKFIARFYVSGKELSKTFYSEEDANGQVIEWYRKQKSGELDPRDYQVNQPLGFKNLGMEFIKDRAGDGLRCLRNSRRHIEIASQHFDNRNIKTIGFKDLKELKRWMAGQWSDKYIKDIFGTLKQFWRWVKDCEDINNLNFRIPKFPETPAKKTKPPILDKKSQWLMLEEVKNLKTDPSVRLKYDPMVYYACLWLTTYTKVRPIELLHVRWSDLDFDMGVAWIERNKVKTDDDKYIVLLQEDIDWLKSLPEPIHPKQTYLFRHRPKKKGVSREYYENEGGRINRDCVWKAWRQAYESLKAKGVKIKYVPLYPGTRHSSATALRESYRKDEIRDHGTGHRTRIVDVYVQDDLDAQREMSRVARYGAGYSNNIKEKNGRS